VLAHAVKKVERVFMLEEFGVPEAMWVIHVEKFPVMVTQCVFPRQIAAHRGRGRFQG